MTSRFNHHASFATSLVITYSSLVEDMAISNVDLQHIGPNNVKI